MADQIQIDVDSSDYTDSDYASGKSSFSTESLSSSIYEYRYENGRRYHAFRDGKYALPNDETEQDRLDIVHHVGLLLLKGKLHLAPIGETPQRILDIGTGTGIWAMDAGETYPSAQVIGTDLSPIQPNWVPPNVTFQIDDVESDWTWPEDHFDFIHIRHMTGAIKDWDALVKKAYSDDNTLKEDMAISKFYVLVQEAAAMTGRPFHHSSRLLPFLESAGFTNTDTRTLKLPLGTWPKDPEQKELGAYFLLIAQTGFAAFGTALLTRVLGMSVPDMDVVVEGARKDAGRKGIHSYAKQYLYWGMKPLE